MSSQLGFPYHYGDKGPESVFYEDPRFAKILFVASVGILTLPQFSFASEEVIVAVGSTLYRKAALETTRSIACAGTGACMVIFSQSLKCGNVSVATAALCGALTMSCIDATAKLALAKGI